MVLKAKSKLSKSPNSATIYLAIPASLASDSQFPFEQDEEVEIAIRAETRTLVISSLLKKK